MGSQASIDFAITASDKTDKGAKSAEKRLERVSKRVGTANRKMADDAEKTIGGSGRRMVRTFGNVESAASKLFGGRSITGGLTSRLSGVTKAASALGEGMGEASAAGGMLEGTIGAVGVAAAGTIGVLAAAAYGAFKLADGWAKGAASIGRTAEIIGVGTKAMQEFSLAAERVGVDRSTATGAVGGLSQTLNDAKYGRNNDALALLGKMGIKLQLNEDGTVDIGAMLPAIANAMARNNSSGRRTIARILGIPEAALPAFTQGGKALTSDMADAGANGVVLDAAAIEKGKRLQRRHAIFGQEVTDKAMNAVGETAAGALDATESALISAGRAIFVGGQTNEHAAKVSDHAAGTMDHAANTIGRAADRMEADHRSRLSNGTLALTDQDVVNLKKTVATEWDHRSTAQGDGIIDTILNRQASGHWGGSVADVVNARSQFSDVNGPVAWRRGGHSVDDVPMSRVTPQVSALVEAYLKRRAQGAGSIVGDNLNYANPYYSDARNKKWIDRLGGPVLGSGHSVHHHGTTPELDMYRPGDFRVGLPASIPVDVTIRMTGAPPGTSASVTAGKGAKPAVSRANVGN